MKLRLDLVSCGLFAALLLASSACVGTDVGNPPQTVKTEVEFVGVDDERGPADESASEEAATDDERGAPNAGGMLHGALVSGDVDVEEAWIVVDALRFRPAEGCEGGDDVSESMLVAVELISGRSYPSVPALALDEGLYCRMEAELAPHDELPAEAPAELAGASVLVRGTFADGSGFTLRYDRPLTLRYRAPGEGMEVAPSVRLFGGFRVAEWFRDEPGAASEAEADVEIDPQSDPVRVERFIAAFRASTKLHRDDNGNRSLDLDEVERPVADSVAENEDDAEDDDHS